MCGVMASTVYCLLSTVYASLCCVGSACLIVLGCGIAGCGVGVMFSVLLSSSLPCLSSLSSLSSSSLFFAVGVRGSARAALRARTLSPNTIVFLLFLLSLFVFAPRLSSVLCSSSFSHAPLFCVFGIAVGGYHVSLCCVGMTATGSLSRSSWFFW